MVTGLSSPVTVSMPCFTRDSSLIAIAPLYEHRRVQDISLFPTVKLSSVGVVRDQYDGSHGAPANIPDTPATTPPPTWKSTTPAKMAIYNENFDDMTDVQKAETIVMLIETLPPILKLRAYLLKQSKRSIPSLKAWKDRITPAALGMLRWIIASNRSCIVQVDKVPGQAEDDGILSKVKLDQRISNVTDNWVQFRFAQGSPDKEQRFLKALKDEQANLDANHPTLFAFHGSPVQNWHSIIRAGLDFNEVANGRAYGFVLLQCMTCCLKLTCPETAYTTLRINLPHAVTLSQIW